MLYFTNVQLILMMCNTNLHKNYNYLIITLINFSVKQPSNNQTLMNATKFVFIMGKGIFQSNKI